MSAAPAVGQRPGDEGLALVIPIGVSGWAIAAGYVALISLLFTGLPGLVLYGERNESRVVFGVVLLVIGVLPVALFALLGHRAIRQNPQKRGMGRVGFAWVVCALLIVEIGVGILRNAF